MEKPQQGQRLGCWTAQAPSVQDTVAGLAGHVMEIP